MKAGSGSGFCSPEPQCVSAVVPEKVKDYRYYLRMWAKEKEPKTETIKDLPRMNQVRMRPVSGLCVSLSVPDLTL